MAKPINVVYTNAGTIGIENQTRYDTSDLLAIANWLEDRLSSEEEPRHPIGSVIQFVDWIHETPRVNQNRWENGSYVVDSRPNWLDMVPRHAWNVVRIVPPNRLLTNPIEALSWDGKEAPRELVNMIILRLGREFGHWRFSDPKTFPEMRVRINGEAGSRRRGADRRVERMSIGLGRMMNSRRHTRRSGYRLSRAKGFLNTALEDFGRVDPSLKREALGIIEEIRNVEAALDRVAQRMQELYDIAATNNYTKPHED